MSAKSQWQASATPSPAASNQPEIAVTPPAHTSTTATSVPGHTTHVDSPASNHYSTSTAARQYRLSQPSLIEPPPPLHSAFNTSHTAKVLRHATTRTAASALAEADGNARHNLPQLSEHHKHEQASTVLATLLHRWLPSLLSARPIRHTFTRNVDNAIRGVIAVVTAAVIAVHTPWSLNVLAVPYLFVVICSVTIKPTVGATMATIEAQCKGILATVIVDTIILAAHIADLSQTHRVIVVEVLLFVTSIGLAYYFHPPLSRRFALGVHALIMVDIALGANQVLLPLKILLNFVLAYCVSFVLALLPCPRLARDELLDRYQQSLLTLSDVFNEVVQCYLSTEPIAPQVLQAAGSSQLDRVFKSLTIMRRLKAEAAAESRLFSLLFPWSITVGCPVVADVDRIEQLYWIDVNLLTTLATLHYSSSHASFITFLRDAFRQLCTEQSTYLTMLGHSDSCTVTRERVAECKERLDDAMAEAWRAYTRARCSLYGVNVSHKQQPMGHASPTALSDQPQQQDSTWQRQQSDARPTENSEPLESTRLLMKGEMQSDGARSQSPTNPPIMLTHSTADVFNRQSFFFHLSRFHHTLQLLPLDSAVLAVSPTLSDHVPSTTFPIFTSSSSSPSTSTVPFPTVSSWPRKRFALRRLATDLFRHPLSWSLLGLHPVRDLLHVVAMLGHFVSRPSVDWLWLRGSVKVSFIVCVVSLIGAIPQLAATNVLPNATWAAFTAGLLASDSEGALLQQGLYRIFGTLLGGFIGYCILYAFPHNWYGSIPLVGFWCFCMQFVQNSAYGLLGMLAAFTPIIIVFGYRLSAAGSTLTVERYALVRMEEIGLAVLISVVLSSVLWPVSSIRLLRSEIMVSVESFKAAMGRTIEIYDKLLQDEKQHIATQTTVSSDQKPTTPAVHHSAEEERKVADGGAVAIELSPFPHASAQAVNGVANGDKLGQSPAQSVAATGTNEQCSQSSATSRSHPCLAMCSVCNSHTKSAVQSLFCVSLSVGHSAVLLEQCTNVAVASDPTAGRGRQRASHPLHPLPRPAIPAAVPHPTPHLVPHPHTPPGTRERTTHAALGPPHC